MRRGSTEACLCSAPGNGHLSERSVVHVTRYHGRDSAAWLLFSAGLAVSTRSVALKLNLCEYRAGSSGATTSPAFVADLVSALRDRCPRLARIVLIEADSSGTLTSHLFPLLGFSSLAEREGLELFDPRTSKWRLVDHVGTLPVEVPEVVYEVDQLLNIPKMKLHGRTAFTGALKNNFGLLRRRWKVAYHKRLNEAIIASNRHLPRQLTVMDGTSTVSGRGPAYGVPVRPNVALASWDPVAADATGARLLRVPLPLARHIGLAERSGLGSSRPDVHWAAGGGVPAERPSVDWIRFAAANVLRRI